MIRPVIAVCAGSLALGSVGGIDGQAQELSSAVLKKVRRATVEVHLKGQLRGGGVFVRAPSDGRPLVLTAAHLFSSPKDTCRVIAEDDSSFFASLTAYDLGHDLALLEVAPDAARYGALEVATSCPPDTEPIFNFGPALQRRTLVLSGHVADSRTCYTDFSASSGYLAHYFAAGINPVLTSGGTWVNRSGKIVGIQHGRLIGDQGAPSSGLSMVSLPSAVSRLLRTEAVASTPSLGGYVWELWTADRSLIDELPEGLQGLVVRPVFKDRPLDRAGVKEYEVIVACDNKPVRRRHHLISAIRAKPAGSTFQLEIISPGTQRRRMVSLTTDSLEEHWK